VYFQSEFGIDSTNIGYVLVFPVLAYIFACPAIGVLNKHFNNNVFAAYGLTLTMIGAFLAGPSLILGLPSKLSIVVMGYACLYVGAAIIVILALPTIIKDLSKIYNLSMENEELNDKAAGIFNAFWSLGTISAPIIGGAIND
jgi:MFS family permease